MVIFSKQLLGVKECNKSEAINIKSPITLQSLAFKQNNVGNLLQVKFVPQWRPLRGIISYPYIKKYLFNFKGINITSLITRTLFILTTKTLSSVSTK